jgi:predicted dehydrogenase
VTSGTIEIKPAVFTPDGDGNNDQAFIYYQFGQAGFIGNATVFDSYGREIKRIAKNTVLGTEGFLIWDGSNEEEQKAPVGSYLIMLEVFQTQGTTAYFKRTVVLGARL